MKRNPSGLSFGTVSGEQAHFRLRFPVDVVHVQEFIALLLHEVQLLRRVRALSHLDWAFRAFELDLHGRNIDRRIGTETYAKDVLVLQ